MSEIRIVSKGNSGRRPFFRRRKSCPFSGKNAIKIDYKDTRMLQRFISERGKIVPPKCLENDHSSLKSQNENRGPEHISSFTSPLPADNGSSHDLCHWDMV